LSTGKYPFSWLKIAQKSLREGGSVALHAKFRLTGRKFVCYSPAMDNQLQNMTDDQLRTELARLKDSLCDMEDMHSFTFGKTTVHIGAEQAQSMQAEFEEECRMYRERIAMIEGLLKTRGSRGTS
jgi:hypothetical protein